MKKQHLISTVTTFFVATVVAMSLASHKALAATGQIYLSPASLSVQKDSNVTMQLRINPGTGVDSVQLTVNFDSSQLQYVGYATSSSAFPGEMQQTLSGGSLRVSRGIFTGAVSSDAQIETLTFKALSGSGTTSVTLSDANAVDHATGTYTNPSVGNATVSFSTPPATCPTGQTGTPPNCTTPPPSGGGTGGGSGGGTNSGSGSNNSGGSGGGAKKPVPQPSSGGGSAPTVVGAPATQFTTASVSATTQVPTQVYLVYGTNANTLDQKTPLSSFATSHNISLADAHLTPGETYYYIVVSKDQSGHIAQSSVQSFTTKGLTITIGVYDKNHNPVRNKMVTLHSTPMTGKTDDRGFVTFSNVIPGEHHVIYEQGGKQYDQPVAVLDNVVTNGDTQTAPVQNFSVAYGFTQSSNTMQRGVILALVVLVAVVIVVFVIRRVRGANTGTPYSMQAAVVQGGPDGPQRPAAANVMQPPATTQEMINRLNSIPDPTRPNPGSTVMPVDNVPPTPPAAGQSSPPGPGPINPQDPPKVG